ncbi:disulfide bond formation protein DsbA [Variovorax sp. WS11]|uniref:2-hydroxychromene-2-carboxylate isomerase n=1 Tax=Variovorax sp. WS11 TaxID=1105204 RepID=UPI000D0D3DBC|nr:2-hydroxychromene-2-carboxylate isomerase [Variovorax sp. WS11]NDZ17645.1 2-hydroxychromene-2-carboxylate isomerase [Variovorax sp. WS11]PSL79573.1 disulfide bond formation protein DsbA [Variovorax sp. WS11]
MMSIIDFFFDYGSPTSYLAYVQMPGVAKRTGATINYKPFLLGGVYQATQNRSPMEIPAKRDWMLEDMKFFAKRYGVAFQFNPHFPINTLHLMRGAMYAQREGFLVPYSDAIFKAMWVDAKNLGDVAVIAQTLKDAGLDGRRIIEATQEPAVKDSLKAATEEASKRGLFGAPTVFVGSQMFFGQDRVQFVEELVAATR